MDLEDTTVGKDEFEEFMADQIEEIKRFRQELEDELGRSISIDEAARRWIKEYADRFRQTYKQEKRAS